MNGGSLSAGNYSNTSNTLQNMNSVANGLFGIARTFADIAMNNRSNETSRYNTDKQAETQKEIAKINAQSQETQTLMKIRSDEKLSNASLSHDLYKFNVDDKEKKYQFDKAQELLIHQIQVSDKSVAIDNLSNAYDYWYLSTYGSHAGGEVDLKSIGSALYSAAKKGLEGISQQFKYKDFWDWYTSNFALDLNWSPSVSRSDYK